jgi:hypothetical protein
MPASASAPLANSASGRLPHDFTTTSLESCTASLYARMSEGAQLAIGAHHTFPLMNFRYTIRLVPTRKPLNGIVPHSGSVSDGESVISQYVEKREGEVALDAYVRAQVSAPEVVKRITELENCLLRLANAVLASSEAEKHPEMLAAAEEAKLVLKNRLEVDNTKHQLHTELGVFPDELKIFKK